MAGSSYPDKLTFVPDYDSIRFDEVDREPSSGREVFSSLAMILSGRDGSECF